MSTTAALSLRDAALRCARRGFPVFPLYEPAPSAPSGVRPDGRPTGGCACQKAGCEHAGKHPRIGGGLRHATTDAGQVDHWWRRWPEAGIGLRTGDALPSGGYLAVADVDPRSDGDATLAELEAKYGTLPETLTVRTGGGGWHYYFSTSEPLPSRKLGDGLDLKAAGGYVVAPPSLHSSGSRYETETRAPIAPAPVWLVQMATERSGGSTRQEGRVSGAMKLSAALVQALASGRLARLWEHGEHRGRDRSRSGCDAALAGLLGACGFEDEDVEAALRVFPHGQVSETGDARQIGRLLGIAAEARARRDAHSSEAEPMPRGLVLVKASTLTMKPTEFLWRPRLVLGAANLLVGEQGLGKSMLTVWLTAQATLGTLSGDLHGTPCDVLIATAEDDIEHTLLARLTAARADLERVHFVQLWREGVEVGLTLPDDVAALTLRVEETAARLVIIDPIMAHLSGRIDSHKDQSIRLAVAPLHRMAERTRCAVVAIGHLNKGESVNLFKRIGGSMGLSGAVRSALLMAADPEAKNDPDARVLLHGKANLSKKAPALRLRVREAKLRAEDGRRIDTAVMEVGEEAPHVRVEDALMQAESLNRGAKRDEAAGWLRAKLTAGEQPADDLLEEAARSGITERTLRRAKDALKVEARRDGFGPGSRWLWALPEDGQPSAATSVGADVATYGESKVSHGVSGRANPIGGQHPELAAYGTEPQRSTPPDPLFADLARAATNGEPEDAP